MSEGKIIGYTAVIRDKAGENHAVISALCEGTAPTSAEDRARERAVDGAKRALLSEYWPFQNVKWTPYRLSVVWDALRDSGWKIETYPIREDAPHE